MLEGFLHLLSPLVELEATFQHKPCCSFAYLSWFLFHVWFTFHTVVNQICIVWFIYCSKCIQIYQTSDLVQNIIFMTLSNVSVLWNQFLVKSVVIGGAQLVLSVVEYKIVVIKASLPLLSSIITNGFLNDFYSYTYKTSLCVCSQIFFQHTFIPNSI